MDTMIRYATTSDGVNIAYCTIGEGRPLVGVPSGPMGITAEWQVPGYRRWYERLARKRMLILYDARGIGLSEGKIADASLDPQMLDLDAVVNHLELPTFDLSGPPLGGPLAIAYAAAHPQRVSHLLLWCTFSRALDFLDSPPAQVLLALIDKDWEIFTETMSHVIVGWSSDAEAHQFAGTFRENVTREAMEAFMLTFSRLNVTDLLPQVRSPTLVVHRRQNYVPGLDVARDLAARIPGAHLALLEGRGSPWLDDMEASIRAIETFLDEGVAMPAGIAPSESVTTPSNEPASSLTPRETEVLTLLAGGWSAREIAVHLTVSLSTVQRHIANIYAKIGARGRVEAAAYAIERGLVRSRDT